MKNRLKLWTFRILAVAFGVFLIALAEGIFRLAGWGNQDPLRDPFLQATATPVFELSADRTHNQTRQEKLHVFPPQQFPVQKSINEIRIFCLGGSTVQGRPYSSPTAFPAWLQLNLKLAHPEHQWTVINCGGISYGTQRLIPVLDECLTHQPDLIILCTGHNEFLERQIYDRFPVPALTIARALHGLHLYRALESLTDPQPPSASPLPSEVDTVLDHPGGLESFHYDPSWRKHVIATFEENLRHLVGAANRSSTPILLVHPPSNLKNCPPIKSEFTRALSGPEQSRWNSLLSANRLNEALQLDPHHPLTHYLLGQSYFAKHDFPNALQHLTLARDHDICPLRILTPMEQSLRTVSSETGTPLIDANKLLASECPAAIPGSQILVDHVHPSMRGHQLMAEHLLPTVSATLNLTPADNFQATRPQLYQTHIESLPGLYFTHGLRRQRAVQAWTEGRVAEPHHHPKPAPPPPSKRSLPPSPSIR